MNMIQYPYTKPVLRLFHCMVEGVHIST